MIRFTDNTFSDNYITTIGVDFKIKTLEIESKSAKLQIWDTAGQERFKNIISSYYKGAQGVMLVYDITDIDSFECLNSWLIEIEKNAPKNVYKILVGNKCDLENERKIKIEQGEEFARQYGMKFFETSAKDSTNVIEAFTTMTKELIKNNSKKEMKNKKNIFIDNYNIKKINKNIGCC